MSEWPDPLVPLGTSTPVLIAALAGGVCRWLVRPGISLRENAALVVVGALTAIYLAPVAMDWVADVFATGATGLRLLLATAFALALAGNIVCEAVILRARSLGEEGDNPRPRRRRDRPEEEPPP